MVAVAMSSSIVPCGSDGTAIASGLVATARAARAVIGHVRNAGHDADADHALSRRELGIVADRAGVDGAADGGPCDAGIRARIRSLPSIADS